MWRCYLVTCLLLTIWVINRCINLTRGKVWIHRPASMEISCVNSWICIKVGNLKFKIENMITSDMSCFIYVKYLTTA